MAEHTVVLTDADRFPLNERQRATLATHGIGVVELSYRVSEEELVSACRNADAVLVYSPRFTRAVIRQLTRCRILARCGTGYDNIDVAAAWEAGIAVSYVPDYGTDTVADHTLALLLDCCRKVTEMSVRVRQGDWPSYPDLRPLRQLRSLTVGLIGYGRIARAVHRRLLGFGCRVLAYDPYLTAARFEDMAITLTDLPTLLREADVVSLHVPLTEATRHFVDAALLSRMKHGAILVNTSRGALIDEAALAAAIRAGRIAAAGLDVLAHEPLSPASPLWALEHVIITPHAAAFSEEALTEVADRAIEDVLRVLSGQSPRNPVPTAAGKR